MNILSIDVGGVSTGYCSRDLENNKITGGVIRSKNHLEKDKTITELRRKSRSLRRIIFRKKERNEKLLSLFQHIKWIKNEHVLELWKNRDLLTLRIKALSEEITSDELAQIIYGYGQRRGYLGDSNELIDYAKKENKKEKSEGEGDSKETFRIDHLDYMDKMTPAQFLFSKKDTESRSRGRVFLNSDLEKEFNLIWEKQKEFNSIRGLNNDFSNIEWNNIIDNICHKKNIQKAKKGGLKFLIWNYIISYKRPLKSYRKLIKDCIFFPNKKATLKCYPEFQEYRILDKIYDIRKVVDNKNIPLSQQEIEVLYTLFNNSKSITYNQIKKVLGCDFNYPKKTNFSGNITRVLMLDLFPDWDTFTSVEQDEIIHLIYDEKGSSKCLSKLNLTDIYKLKSVYHSLDKGHAEFSKKALNQIILPKLSQGKCLYDIKDEFNLNNTKINIKSITNPSIKNKLSILDKIMNYHKKDYGSLPTKVFIEVVRENLTSKAKSEYTKSINLKREKNEKVSEILIKNGIEPNRNNIRKYNLWEDSNELCVYTGKKITLAELFSHRYEVEHIWLNYNSSYDNLVISCREFNARKGNRTPYQMVVEGIITPEQYKEILNRVLKIKSIDGKVGHLKYKYFSDKIVASDLRNNFDLLHQKNLVDTSYTAKIYSQYIKDKFGCEVQTIKPSVVSQIRYKLKMQQLLNDGFDSVMQPHIENNPMILKHIGSISKDEKNRLDNRHHLVDAIAMSFVDYKIIQKVGQHSPIEREDLRHLVWNNWRDDVKNLLSSTIVNTCIRHRDVEVIHGNHISIRGELHKEQFKKKDSSDALIVIKQDKENVIYAKNSENIFLVIYQDLKNGKTDYETVNLHTVLTRRKNKLPVIQERQGFRIVEVFKKNNYYLIDNGEYRFSEMTPKELDSLPRSVIFDNVYRLFKFSENNANFVHHILSKTGFGAKKIGDIKLSSKVTSNSVALTSKKMKGYRISISNDIKFENKIHFNI